LLNALNLLNTCELGFKQSNNQRLHVELTLLKLCNLMQVIKPNTQQPPVDEKKKMTENIIQPNDNAAVISKPEGINPTQTQQYKQPVSDIQPVTSTSKLEKLKLQVKQQLQNQRLAEEVNGKEVAVIDEPEQKNQFTFDEFLSVWNEFLIQLDKQNKTRISSFLKNANTTRIDDFTIEVELRSKLEEELFDEERMNMIPYFRKNLQNSFFDFKTRINEDLIDTTSKPTKQELLKILTEENQHLKTLIQKLGLEIDY
jgi:DNA polymerase-3 subunit gamma/tau